MRETEYGKDNNNVGGIIVFVIIVGLLGGGIYLTTINGEQYTVALGYHRALKTADKYIFSAENSRNMSIVAIRLDLAYNSLKDWSGNYDWCMLGEWNCVIDPSVDLDLIKEAIQSASNTAKSLGNNATALDYTAMNLQLESISFDIEAADNITTKPEWDSGWALFGSVIMIIVGGIVLIVAIKVIMDN